MKVKDLKEHLGQPSAAPTHVYDRATKRTWTAERHGILRGVRRDIAEGRPVWIPKETKRKKI